MANLLPIKSEKNQESYFLNHSPLYYCSFEVSGCTPDGLNVKPEVNWLCGVASTMEWQ